MSDDSARRIAITGIGSINALGTGVAAFVEGLRAGRCAIRELRLFSSAGYRSTLAAEVTELPLPPSLPLPIARRASRTDLLAVIAADEAMRHAALPPDERTAAGVIVGTTTGGMLLAEESYRRRLQREPGPVRVTDWLATPVAAVTDLVAHVFECGGPRLTVSTACSSSANALALAADWIRSGRAPVVLCGGSDSLCRMTYSGFNALQALDRVPCRPFDRDRAGLTLGEGAAFFVFEDWQSAHARGAAILGEFVIAGISADAHHLTQPRPDGAGAVMAMRRALADGGVAPAAIDYINAHGTGTPLNDAIETRAIKAVLGAHVADVPVSSTKSMIGHCLGAAGAIEALASLLAVREGFLPPTANLAHADRECDLDYVPQQSRPARVRTVLSNSYGFGGNNTSVIVRAADSTVDAPRLRTTECADGADRIVVTGIGVVSPIGIGCEQFWNALCRGESGVTVLTDEALTHGVPTLGAPVREFAPREFIASTHLRRMDALSRMIVAASRMALDDARFLGARVPTDRVGVVVGSAIGDVAGSLAHLDKVFTKGPAAASPMNFPNLVLNAPASYVAMEFGFTGVNLTVAHAEVSGEHALVAAIDALRAGRADVMLAGGGDELGTIVLEVLRRLRVLAGQRGGRMWVSPYDRGRSGIALGEGAAMLVLERAPHARARGARAYAEVAGTTCFSVPAPLYHWPASAAAAAPALRRLVGDAPVDVVCGSANSSARLDAAELELLGAVTGPDQSRPVVTSIKGAIGEFGAAGALTSAAACLALHTQTVPPLCRLDDPEPGAVRFAAPRGEPHAMRRALVCGLARGGAGVALQFDRARI